VEFIKPHTTLTPFIQTAIRQRRRAPA